MFKAALLVILLLVVVSACSLNQICNTPEPNVLLFPNSNLTRKTADLDSAAQSIFTYTYRTTATWEQLADYYSAKINCRTATLDQNRIVCRGSAKPYGIYYVYIDKTAQSSEHNLNFTIEIAWQKQCTLTIKLAS